MNWTALCDRSDRRESRAVLHILTLVHVTRPVGIGPGMPPVTGKYILGIIRFLGGFNSSNEGEPMLNG